MKKFLFKPGFEFIFALSLMVILGLPPMLLAQNQKDLEIKIEHGDTTINGKNIKELSAKDRQSALRDISHINAGPAVTLEGRKDGDVRRKIIIRRDTGEYAKHRTIITQDMVMRDSLGNVVHIKQGNRADMAQGFAFRNRMNDESPDRRILEDRGFNPPLRSSSMRFDRRNSQRFDYVNTDNEGISTHVSFRVSEPSNDDLKKIPHVEGPKFEIKDLNLVPEFTTGKTLLMFSLLSKANAEVKLTDSEGKLMWSEKAIGGSFNKAFPLGLNGIYYLQIKQGSSISVKKIVKEE
jgi:hypothetical protein